MKNLIIVAFLALQIGLPLSYYLGDQSYDERFAWRMFSPVRVIKCKVELYDATDGSRERLNPYREMHVVWRNLMLRARLPVVRAFARHWCDKQTAAGRDAPDLRVDLACGPPDGRLLGICREGPEDRDADGVPDGYARTPGCRADPKGCFVRDCGEASPGACHLERCTVPIVTPDQNLCAEGALMAAWNRYWHDFAVHPLRMACLRVAVFGLLAYDLWVNFIVHAPRYGAGGVNATQFAWLDALAPTPTPAVVGAAWLIAGFLAARAMFGVAVRQSVALLALLYGAVYLWSMADSYQHHYLVALLLGIAAFIPTSSWHATAPAPAAPDAEPPDAEPPEPTARHWAIRMIYVQLALLYFWTGVTKINAVWLSGDTMMQLTSGIENRAMMEGLGSALGLDPGGIYPVAAWGVMIGELVAPIFFLWRRLWWVGLLVVPWFHIGVEVIEFDIELFSYYMILIDVILLAPRRVYVAMEVGRQALAARLAPVIASMRRAPSGRPAAIAIAIAIGLATAMVAMQVPYEGALAVGLLAGGLAFVAAWPGRALPAIALAHLLSAGALVACAHATDAPFDYYRLWGGDLKKRGETDAAIAKYTRANQVTAGPARHYALGQLFEKQGKFDDARSAYGEDIARHERALQGEKKALFKDSTNGEKKFDVASRHATLAGRTKRLARAWRRAGETDKAAEQERASARHLADARAAVADARQLAPRSRRHFRILRQLERLERVIAGPDLFLSDLHFHDGSSERGRRLLEFLGGWRGRARSIYLVGDVFDFWLGHETTLYRACFPMLRVLADLVDAGTAVHLFSGNHDPDPGSFFGELGVTVHEGAFELELGSFRVRLEHGDIIDPRGRMHRAVCKAVRHPLLRAGARRLPAGALWRLSRWYAAAGEHTYDAPLPAELLDSYLPARVRAGIDVLVMGHYHRAVHHRTTVDGRPARFYGLGDWVAQRTWLQFDGDFVLYRDQGRDRPPIVLPQGDHGPILAPDPAP